MRTAMWTDGFKFPQGLLRLASEHGAQTLVTILLAALALDVALLLTHALGGIPQRAPSAPGALPSRPLLAASPSAQLAAIVDAHLFGTAPGAEPTDAPETTAPLILAGVIADRDPHRGQAIIGPDSAGARLYAVGAVVGDGARLNSVYSDRVLLERAGHLETLMLPRTQALAEALAPAPPRAAPHRSLARAATLLSGLVRVQPVFHAGHFAGYRIFPAGSRGVRAFNDLGLRPGDMVLAVNGTSLSDPSRALEVLQTLSSASSASLTVSRHGQAQQVNLNLAELATLENAQAPATAPGPRPTPFRFRRVAPAPGGAAARNLNER